MKPSQTLRHTHCAHQVVALSTFVPLSSDMARQHPQTGVSSAQPGPTTCRAPGGFQGGFMQALEGRVRIRSQVHHEKEARMSEPPLLEPSLDSTGPKEASMVSFLERLVPF